MTHHLHAGAEIGLVDWRLKDFDAGAGEAAEAFDAALDDTTWIDVSAPGDVYLALHAAGRLPGPFGDRAEPACAWVQEREWWYRADVEAPSVGPKGRLVLEFEGLDTFATLWLNGEPIATTDNMFRAWRFDVTHRLQRGRNRLAISFAPASAAVAGKEMPLWSIISDPIVETKRNFVRKAQFGWGWDFGPRLPTVGIWKPARLKAEAGATLQAPKFTTLRIAPDRRSARVSIETSVDALEAGDAAPIVWVTLRAPDGGVVVSRSIDLVAGQARTEFTIDRPMLWWTPELGAANLYALQIELRSGDAVIDRCALQVGIRTIGLDTSADAGEPGASFFRFVLNGVPIFARGACWAPASAFVATVDEPHYRRLLQMAAQANMNMVRVWGVGVYEHDAFYELCDELGLLVWQDFMFACAPYPEHEPAFVENVRAEVDHQIKRLRNHACLALWCGNNEAHAVQAFMNRMTQRDDPLLGALYYDKMMPAAVKSLDPTTPYWPSSPFGGPKNSHNSMMEGDGHDWTVWHGLPPTPAGIPVGELDRSPKGVTYTRYAEDSARFVSEFGIQASPVLETLRRVLPPDQLVLGSPGLLSRIKDHPTDKIDAMLIPVTGLPNSLEEYVDFTQITQAEGLKFGIEHFRRRKPHCSGSLIWQYNDCWPGISWSLVDYHGFAKASYFYVRRAYAPLMASFKSSEGGVELWLVNDTLLPVAGELRLCMATFAGETLWEDTFAYLVGPNASRCVWRSDAANAQGERGHVLMVRATGDRFAPNRHFFAALKDLDRPMPEAPRVELERLGAGELAVRITASVYLYFVHVLTPDERVSFSDNYIDLAAGETRVIRVRKPGGALDAESLSVRWR